MILRDGIVLLEFADLVNVRCLTKAAYDKAVRDGRITVVQKGGGGHPALLSWGALAPRYQDMVREHLGGDPVQLAQAEAIERHLQLLPEDERYIDEFKASNGLMLSNDKRTKLKAAARVMALLAELDERHRILGTEEAPRTYGFESVLRMKEVVLQYIKLKRIDLPGSFARLEARKRAYLKARAEGEPGAASLIHGGQGNSNSSKLLDPVQKGMLETLASRHQNLGYRQIADHYNLFAQAQGWPTLTANTVSRYLSAGDVSRSVTFFAKGAAAYQGKHGIVVHRSRPTQPTYLWVHDATTYELYYQQQRGGRTTYHHRKQVCVVLDPHSWYPVGYAIGEVDNLELTKAAIANAVAHMKELTGSYLLPYQAQSDRLGHKELGRWYGTMGVTYTPAKARNARAKVIEPYFRHHHAQHVQAYYPNWSGHNVTAKLLNQPNPDALERIKKDFPTEAGVVDQIHEAFARERAAKVAEFRQALEAAQAKGILRSIDRQQYLELFGVQHDYTNELTNRGLCPTLLGEERHYNILSHEFQQWVGTSFRVTYDPADLSNVLATAREGSLRFLVSEVADIPMALADHTPQTRAQLAAVEGFKKELGQQAIDRRDTSVQHARAIAARLLDQVALRVDLTEPKERVLELTEQEEATTRSYATTNGSHKEALRQAEALRMDPERFAEENL